MLKKTTQIILSLSLLLGLSACQNASTPKANNNLYQTSTINTVVAGNYEGTVTFKTLKEKGNFGLGTFNDLEGEMLGLDGYFYRIKADGIAYPVKDTAKTPFAIVTDFKEDMRTTLHNDTLNFGGLKNYLDTQIPTKNIFYAIKIVGTFSYLKTRSVPKQSKPYPPLAQVVATQPTFTFNTVKGTLVGFRFPAYAKGINVPGYHFHFLTEDKTKGGHVLEFTGFKGTVALDSIHSMALDLSHNKAFYTMEADSKIEVSLEKVEK